MPNCSLLEEEVGEVIMNLEPPNACWQLDPLGEESPAKNEGLFLQSSNSKLVCLSSFPSQSWCCFKHLQRTLYCLNNDLGAGYVCVFLRAVFTFFASCTKSAALHAQLLRNQVLQFGKPALPHLSPPLQTWVVSQQGKGTP